MAREAIHIRMTVDGGTPPVRVNRVSSNTREQHRLFEELASEHGADHGVSLLFAVEASPPLVLAWKGSEDDHVAYTEAWRERFGQDGPMSAPAPRPR